MNLLDLNRNYQLLDSGKLIWEANNIIIFYLYHSSDLMTKFFNISLHLLLLNRVFKD